MASIIKKGAAKKTEGKVPDNLIVSEMTLMSADRSRKDIGDFSRALVSAESILMPNRVLLYNLYENIKLDAFLTGIINKRYDAVLNKAINYVANNKRVDGFDMLIKSKEFRRLVRNILETFTYGITGMEFVPGKEFAFVDIPRKHIKPEKGIITLQQNDQTGIPYADLPNVIILGDPKDLGLYLKCAPYCIYKRGNWGDWAQYVEIFGQPIRIIKYDAYDNRTKIELKQVLDESGSALALMIPKQADFEIMDGKGVNGDGRLQTSFKAALDEELSILILGNTETTSNANGGSNAKAKEHGKQQLEITKSDMKYVLGELNSDKFKAIFKSYGFPVEGGEFEFEKELDLDALKTRVEIDAILKTQMLLPMTDDYVYEMYGVPKPDNYDELIAKREADKAAAAQPPAPAPEDPKQPPVSEGKQPPVKKKDPLKKDLKDESEKEQFERNLWFKFRASFADFFDRAP